MDMDLKALGGLKIPGLSGELLSRALGRMRSGEVIIQGGFDGEYGVIRVFAPGETKDPKAGAGLFGALPQAPPEKEKSRKEGCPPRPSPEKPRSRGKSPATGPAPEAAFSLHRDQEAVITHDAPRALIIAGPGTGKTSTLAAKIARLIDGGQDPASILAISFTVKAAAELGERIARNVSPAPAAVPVMTFHALGCSILRDHCREAGLNPDFTILDEEARNKLLRDITGGVSRPKSLGAYIEKRKRYLLLPGEKIPQIPASASCFGPMLRESPVESEGGSLPPGPHKVAAHPPQRGGFPPATPPLDFPQAEPEMESLYAEYRNRLRSLGTLDFDDLVSGAFRLLAVKPEILRAYRKRFRTIFVDEYQDINFAQYALIRLLSSGESPKDPVEKPPDLWVIGDPNQAIYGFRGSDKAFIDRFKEDYPEASFLSLSQSFRCAQPILDAAGQLTGTVLQGIPAGGAALFRSEYPTEKSEAEGIARRIAGLIGGTGFFAIDSGAAGDLEGGASPGDCAVLVRAAVLGGPIVKALKDHGIPFEFAGEKPWWEDEDVKKVLAPLRERPDQAGNPREAVRKARESAGWKSGTAMPASLERLEAFAALFGKDDGVRAFLDALSWGGGEEFSPPRQNAVRIMTMHASKGLEFEHVFAAGLEEGLLPFTLYDSPGDDKAGTPDPRDFVEEEKRLLYMAMTRAKRGLYLSWARERKFRGRTLPGGPSPFLAQLESVIPLERTERKIKRDSQPGLF